MPVFTLAGTAVATAVLGAAAVGTVGFTAVAGVTAFALSTATMIGANMLLQKAAGTPDLSPDTNAKGSGFSIQGQVGSGADYPRSFPLGWRATAGSMVYANTWGKANDTPNSYLTQIIALSDLPLRADDEGLVGMWVDGEPVTIDWDNPDPDDRGYPVTEYQNEEGNKSYMFVKFYDGTQVAADSFVIDSVSHVDRPWSATDIGIGVAYAVVTCRINHEMFNGIPNFIFELAGVKLYDPSKDSTVGGTGTQVWDTPSTWGGDGDDYPIVQLYNVLRGITYDDVWLYGLQNMNETRLPVDAWIAAINTCRESITAPEGGTEARYRSSLEIRVDNEIGSTVEALLTACQGRLCESGGYYKPYVGAPGNPVMGFTDADIIRDDEQTFTPFFGLADTVTGMTATHPSPEEGWQSVKAPPIYRADLEQEAGDRRLPADVKLDMVPYARQVQQLMKESIQEAQRARRHTFTLPPKYWVLEPGDVISWTSERNGYSTKLFRVDGVLDRQNLNVVVDLTEVDPDDYDWDTTGDYELPTTYPPVIFRPPSQSVPTFAVSAVEVTSDVPGVVRAAIQATWLTTDIEFGDIDGISFEVRRASDVATIYQTMFSDVESGEFLLLDNGILPNTTYGVRARFVSASPRAMEWTNWESVTTSNSLFTFPDFRFAEVEVWTKTFQTQLGKIKEQIQLIGANVADLDSHEYYVKNETRRLIEAVSTSVGAVTTAQIEEILTTIATNEAAFAAYQLEVSATYLPIADLDAEIAAEVSVQITTFASGWATLADYDSEVTAAYEAYATSAAATVQSNLTSFASGYESMASYDALIQASISSLDYDVGQLSASISINTAAIVNLDGYAAASYAIVLDVNGYATGFELFNGGASYSFARFSVDYFQVAKPGVSGGSPTTVFEISTIDGVAGIAFKGNLIADGAIVARTVATDAIVANNITAGAITSQKLSINTYAANLVLNGSFEDDLDDWTVDDNGSSVASVITGSNAVSGANFLRVDRSTSASGTHGSSVWYKHVAATAGRKYRVSCWAKAATFASGSSTTTGFYLRVYWYDYDQVLLSSDDAYTNSGLDGTYTYKSGILTAPAGTCYARVRVYWHTTATARYGYFDDVEFTAAVNGTIIEDDSIITGHIQTDTIVTDHIVSESATALFTATGATAGPEIAVGDILVSVVCNIVNGEALITFDADPILGVNNESNANQFTIQCRDGNNTLFTRVYRGIVTDGDTRIRYPLSFSRVVTLPTGSRTISIRVSALSFSNEQSTVRVPTICVFESRR